MAPKGVLKWFRMNLNPLLIEKPALRGCSRPSIDRTTLMITTASNPAGGEGPPEDTTYLHKGGARCTGPIRHVERGAAPNLFGKRAIPPSAPPLAERSTSDDEYSRRKGKRASSPKGLYDTDSNFRWSPISCHSTARPSSP